MPKLFQKTVENFVCENCRKEVRGNGYTNHCPKCLWSKHDDINPGDRAGQCGGLMKPISFEKKGESYFLKQSCVKCAFERKNNFTKGDNFETLLKLSGN